MPSTLHMRQFYCLFRSSVISVLQPRPCPGQDIQHYPFILLWLFRSNHIGGKNPLLSSLYFQRSYDISPTHHRQHPQLPAHPYLRTSTLASKLLPKPHPLRPRINTNITIPDPLSPFHRPQPSKITPPLMQHPMHEQHTESCRPLPRRGKTTQQQEQKAQNTESNGLNCCVGVTDIGTIGTEAQAPFVKLLVISGMCIGI